MAESAPCLFSLFYKSTLFCCYYDYTQIKVDPFPFQTIPYICAIKNDSIFRSFRGH